jgi:hypothetical protein
MKYSTLLIGLIIPYILLFSCNTTTDEPAEIATNNYVRFVDSVVKKGKENGIKNWNGISKEYDKKSNALHIEIDKLENNSILDEKINRATAKYETFRNQTFEEKIEREMNSDEFL